eukprot:3157100-Rhodomonas_salina.1
MTAKAQNLVVPPAPHTLPSPLLTVQHLCLSQYIQVPSYQAMVCPWEIRMGQLDLGCNSDNN